MANENDERVLANCFHFLIGDDDEIFNVEEDNPGYGRMNGAEAHAVIDVLFEEADLTQWDGGDVGNPNDVQLGDDDDLVEGENEAEDDNSNNIAGQNDLQEAEQSVSVDEVRLPFIEPGTGFSQEVRIEFIETPSRIIATCAAAANVVQLLNQDNCAGPSRRPLARNMLQPEADEVMDEQFFDERDFKGLDGFELESQDLVNMNSQELLKYGEIGNFSDVNDSDLLDKVVFDADENDEPLGMSYVLALKTGVGSVDGSSILFNEIPCFSNYKGDYNFDVLPAPDSKKCIYEDSLNKIYVTLGTFEFKVKLDFASIPRREEFLIRTHVHFMQPENHQYPVSKCINCLSSHQKLLDKDNFESLEFVVRAPHSDTRAVYYKSDATSKLYLFQPVVQPELGCDTISKGLVFTCMNSCRSGSEGGGINRREVALVFTLLNKMHQVVGRRVFTLRICTAPHRDVKLDLEQKAKVKKRRTSSDEKSNLAKRKKTPTDLMNSNPGPSSRVLLKEEQYNNVSSSQETCYSGDEDDTSRKEGIVLRSLFRHSKVILGWKSSNDQRKKDCAKHLFSCLKLAQDIIRSSKSEHDLKQEK